MRAISVWQPWASAIAIGAKKIETRHWETNYRGLLAIHASKRCVKGELAELRHDPQWWAALWPILSKTTGMDEWYDVLPFGAVVATCYLKDCLPVQKIDRDALFDHRGHEAIAPVYTENYLGNFAPGRFGWMLEDVVALPKPILWKGQQGFFDIPDDILAR